MFKYLKSIKEKDPSAKSILYIIFFHPGFKAVCWFRVASFFYNRLKLKFIALWIMYIVRRRTGIEIHPGATIGKRLFIDHGMGVVIGETTIIGDDCTIYHGVTLGARKMIKGKRHPTIKNNVTIGAGAIILGDIIIEDNVIIGAGTIVLDSIKKNSVVVGTKGKIIKKGGTMEKYEIVKSYDDFKSRLDALDKVLNINNMKQEVIQNEVVMSSANFWDDNKKATLFLQNHTSLKEIIQSFESIRSDIEELEVILQLEDETLYLEASEIVEKINKKLDKFEIEQLLNEPYDNLNAIVELHPGAGGTESQDWALMLYRMYKRYSERNNFEFELLSYEEALDAGLKSATFIIKGKNAYGILKGEKGVHRLVRISPFDSNARRHTSFAACNVTPEIVDDIDVEINADDIKIDTYRASGAGGQHVNKTDSAVRITHIPTGIIVCCQNERSQIQNKERALQILKSKIYQKELEKKENLIKNISGDLTDNAFGSQIRSYVLHPYAMVKDHRTLVESSNPNNVLDGDLEMFIDAYLKYNKK